MAQSKMQTLKNRKKRIATENVFMSMVVSEVCPDRYFCLDILGEYLTKENLSKYLNQEHVQTETKAKEGLFDFERDLDDVTNQQIEREKAEVTKRKARVKSIKKVLQTVVTTIPEKYSQTPGANKICDYFRKLAKEVADADTVEFPSWPETISEHELETFTTDLNSQCTDFDRERHKKLYRALMPILLDLVNDKSRVWKAELIEPSKLIETESKSIGDSTEVKLPFVCEPHKVGLESKSAVDEKRVWYPRTEGNEVYQALYDLVKHEKLKINQNEYRNLDQNEYRNLVITGLGGAGKSFCVYVGTLLMGRDLSTPILWIHFKEPADHSVILCQVLLFIPKGRSDKKEPKFTGELPAVLLTDVRMEHVAKLISTMPKHGVVVFDGVRQNIQVQELVSLAQCNNRLVIVVESGGFRGASLGSQVNNNYHVMTLHGWSTTCYLEALQEREILSKFVKTNKVLITRMLKLELESFNRRLPKEKGYEFDPSQMTTESMTNILAENDDLLFKAIGVKGFVAGSNARLMFDRDVPGALYDLAQACIRVREQKPQFYGLPVAHTLLGSIRGGKDEIVSPTALYMFAVHTGQMAPSAALDFVYEMYINCSKNGTMKGCLFEWYFHEVQRYIQDCDSFVEAPQTVPRIANNIVGTPFQFRPRRICYYRHKGDVVAAIRKAQNESNKGPIYFIPLNRNNPGFDSIYYYDRTIVFIQITVQAEHTVKLHAARSICKAAWGCIDTARFIFLTEHERQTRASTVENSLPKKFKTWQKKKYWPRKDKETTPNVIRNLIERYSFPPRERAAVESAMVKTGAANPAKKSFARCMAAEGSGIVAPSTIFGWNIMSDRGAKRSRAASRGDTSRKKVKVNVSGRGAKRNRAASRGDTSRKKVKVD